MIEVKSAPIEHDHQKLNASSFLILKLVNSMIFLALRFRIVSKVFLSDCEIPMNTKSSFSK